MQISKEKLGPTCLVGDNYTQ